MHSMNITVNDVVTTITKFSLTTRFDVNTNAIYRRNCEINDIPEELLHYIINDFIFFFDFNINEYRCIIWTDTITDRRQ